MTATDQIRAAIQRCIDASSAPPTTDDLAAAVLLAASDVLFPEKPEPIEPIPMTTVKAIHHAGDWSAWRALKAAKERLQALAQQLNGTDYGRYRPGPARPVPVAVSERLPEPEDCDAEGRCWWFVPASVLPNGMCPYWCLAPAESPRSWFTHWLPANALPLPSGETEGATTPSDP